MVPCESGEPPTLFCLLLACRLQGLHAFFLRTRDFETSSPDASLRCCARRGLCVMKQGGSCRGAVSVVSVACRWWLLTLVSISVPVGPCQVKIVCFSVHLGFSQIGDDPLGRLHMTKEGQVFEFFVESLCWTTLNFPACSYTVII